MRANETYSEAKRQSSDRNRDVFMNVHSPHKWSLVCCVIKSAVLVSSSSLPPLVSEGGGILCESAGKADLLSDHFDSKQSRGKLICRSLSIRHLDLPPLFSGRVRSGISC